MLFTIEEALLLASKGYYINCRRGNLNYIGYEGRAKAPIRVGTGLS